MNKNLSIIIVAVIVAVTALAVVPSTPAEATLDTQRWRESTVCVEDQINDGKWPGRTAVERWDAVPDLKFVYRTSCSSYTQRIVLKSASKGQNGQYGYSYWWYKSGTNYISRAEITMNDSYLGTGSVKWWDDRISAIMHELGHISGLDHTSRDSLMDISTWHKFSYPTAYDKSEVERRYPW